MGSTRRSDRDRERRSSRARQRLRRAETRRDDAAAGSGDVKVALNNGKLNLRFGPAFTGDREHWHYDTFRARFFAAGATKVFVTFALNAQGKLDTLTLGMPGMADYPFKRVAEK